MSKKSPARSGKIKIPTADVLAEHLKAGMSLKEIGTRYGCAAESIRHKVVVYGLKHLVNYKTPVKPDLPREVIAADRKAGLSFFAIDKKHGVAYGTAKRCAIVTGLETEFEAITFREDKMIIGKRMYNGEYGTSSFMRISLPLIAMHVRHIQERTAS